MRRLIYGALAFLTLCASQAFGQSPPFPQTLPANTVLGRLGVSAGPAQAIPLATFTQTLLTYLAAQPTLTATNHAILLGKGSFGFSSVGPCATGTVLAGVTGSDPTCNAFPVVTGIVAATVWGAQTSVSGTLLLKGTASASPNGDSVVIQSGDYPIIKFVQNAAGNVGGVYLKCFAGNSAGPQNVECGVVSNGVYGGLSVRMFAAGVFAQHSDVGGVVGATFCKYKKGSETVRVCWVPNDSTASSFTLIEPPAAPAGSNYPLAGSASGVLDWIAGVSVTKTVRASGGAGDCTLIFTGGVLTGGSC